jgi:hypothetical protein
MSKQVWRVVPIDLGETLKVYVTGEWDGQEFIISTIELKHGTLFDYTEEVANTKDFMEVLEQKCVDYLISDNE